MVQGRAAVLIFLFLIFVARDARLVYGKIVRVGECNMIFDLQSNGACTDLLPQFPGWHWFQ